MTKHFTLEELTRSSFASRNNIDNTPNSSVLLTLYDSAINLEYLRVLLGNHPILITSGYRNYAVNKGAGGSPTSSHMSGSAFDIEFINNRTIQENVNVLLQSKFNYDEIIVYSSYIHISFRKPFRFKCVYKTNIL